MNPIRLIAMARKELRQLWRDWRTLFILTILPAILLLIFGYALSFDVKYVRLAVLDQDRSPESRELVTSLIAADLFIRVADLESQDEAGEWLDGGKADVALLIPPGFGRDLAGGRGARAQALLDGSDSQKSSTALGYLQASFADYANRIVLETIQRAGIRGLKPPVTAEARIWYNPELRSSMFLVPGLMAFVLMISATTSTALAVVRERERNTIEQLLVSPLGSVEIILGKTTPYVIVSMVAATLLVTVGWILFGVEVRGSLWALAFVSFLFCLAALGQGMLISSVTDSQQVAFFAAVTTTMLPTFLLSGFVFPLESAHPAIQAVSHIIPSRYFITLVRGIILRGAGLLDLWQPALLLTVFSVAILGLASVRVSKITL